MTSNVFAFIALLISVLAFYWSSLRGPKMYASPIRFLRLENIDNSILIVLNISLVNKGSRTGIVDYVFLSIENKELNNQGLKYWARYQEKNIGMFDKESDWKEMALPFSIKPGEAESRLVVFQPHDVGVSNGKYHIKLCAQIAGKKKTTVLQSQNMRIERIPENKKFTLSGRLYEVECIEIK